MFRPWLKVLPLFVIEWLARRYCSVREDGKWIVADPFEGVTVRIRLIPERLSSSNAADVCCGYRAAEYRDGLGRTVWKIEKFYRGKWAVHSPENMLGRNYDLTFYEKAHAEEWLRDYEFTQAKDRLTKV